MYTQAYFHTKEMDKFLSAIGQSKNQIAKRVNAPLIRPIWKSSAGKADSDMALIKTHPIKSTLKESIDNICSPNKTIRKLLVPSFGYDARLLTFNLNGHTAKLSTKIYT